MNLQRALDRVLAGIAVSKPSTCEFIGEDGELRACLIGAGAIGVALERGLKLEEIPRVGKQVLKLVSEFDEDIIPSIGLRLMELNDYKGRDAAVEHLKELVNNGGE